MSALVDGQHAIPGPRKGVIRIVMDYRSSLGYFANL